MMKKTCCALLAALMLPGTALADITSDLTAGVTLQEASKNAIQAGHSPSAVIQQLMAAGVDPFSAAEAVVAVAPENAGELIKDLVQRVPESSGAIVLAAMNNLPDAMEANIVQSAIEGGADPTVVASATAAGRPKSEPVSSGVLTDLAAGLTLQQAASNAIQAGYRPKVVIMQLIAAGVDTFTATEAVIAVAPEQAQDIVKASVQSVPDSSGAIVLAAMNSLPDEMEGEIVQAAIAGGADPTDVGRATAAGRPLVQPRSSKVVSDLGSGGTLQQAARNAIDSGTPPEEVIKQLMAAGVDPFSATEAVLAVAPEQAQEIVKTMVKSLPNSSGAIVLAAMNSLPDNMEPGIVQSAIDGGADPIDVSTATAAGRSQVQLSPSGVSSDLGAGVPLEAAARNAIRAGYKAEAVIMQLMAAGVDAFSATEAVVAVVGPDQAAAIVRTSVRSVPDASGAIVLAAMNMLPDEMEASIVQAAIEGGADPNEVSTATAAGRSHR